MDYLDASLNQAKNDHARKSQLESRNEYQTLRSKGISSNVFKVAEGRSGNSTPLQMDFKAKIGDHKIPIRGGGHTQHNE